MAPEQFDDAKTADARCDVYSLGATLYMAVTGRLPFDAVYVAASLGEEDQGGHRPPAGWPRSSASG